MSDSLRDQLLKAGFKPSPKTQAKADPHKSGPHKQAAHRPQGQKSQRATGEPDLAHAFALRAKADRAEREAVEREARAKAAEKKERKRRLQELLGGKPLNLDGADHVRNFEYAGKIRRIYVSREQLAQLNAGELGVVMHGGRVLLLDRATVLRAQDITPEAVALLVDPSAPVADDGVPDDLMW